MMHTERQTTQHIRYGLTPLPFSRNVVYTGGHKGSGVRACFLTFLTFFCASVTHPDGAFEGT